MGEVKKLKYLGSVLQKNGDFKKDMKHRIKCRLMKRRGVSGILCNKICSIRLKVTFCKTVVRFAMMYGSECWTMNRKIKQSMSLAGN